MGLAPRNKELNSRPTACRAAAPCAPMRSTGAHHPTRAASQPGTPCSCPPYPPSATLALTTTRLPSDGPPVQHDAWQASKDHNPFPPPPSPPPSPSPPPPRHPCPRHCHQRQTCRPRSGAAPGCLARKRQCNADPSRPWRHATGGSAPREAPANSTSWCSLATALARRTCRPTDAAARDVAENMQGIACGTILLSWQPLRRSPTQLRSTRVYRSIERHIGPPRGLTAEIDRRGRAAAVIDARPPDTTWQHGDVHRANRVWRRHGGPGAACIVPDRGRHLGHR
jgi:hypothetical protein